MKIFYTTGFAGTGKSTELLELLTNLPTGETIVLAPTHKALERLKTEYQGGIEMKTIHSLLGLIPRINEKAKTINNLQTLVKLNKDIEQYSHIVIDEAGMINEEHFFDLIAKLEEVEDTYEIDITLHCYLDPYQLLPVKGYQIMTDPATTTNLTTQYRSKSLDIVRTYTKFVNYLIDNSQDDLTVNYSKNILPLDITKFKRGDRLLAFTNKAVGKWNQIIAHHLGITSYVGQEVQIGKEVDTVVVEQFVRPKLSELFNAFEAGTLKLQNSQISKKYLSNALEALLTTKGIEFIQVKEMLIPVIVGIGNAKTILDEAGKAAIKNRSKFVAVYALGRAFVMDYPFASTVHKAQGAEFSTVFVDKLDIQKSIQNNYYELYARLMYVSISRCKDTLYI